MWEARIICPLADNDGNPTDYAREALESSLLDNFGGFTRQSVSGVWRDDNGKVYADDSIAYTIAVENHGKPVGQLYQIAAQLADDAKQECIYLRLPNGNVAFVEPSQPAVAAA